MCCASLYVFLLAGLQCNTWPSGHGRDTLFHAAERPSGPVTGRAAPQAAGVVLKPAAAGVIHALRFFQPAGDEPLHASGQVYDGHGRLLARTAGLRARHCVGWVVLPLIPALPVGGAEAYTVVIDNVTALPWREAGDRPLARHRMAVEGARAGPAGSMPTQAVETMMPWIDGRYCRAVRKLRCITSILL